MPEQLQAQRSRNIDEVGRTGLYPMSGPHPDGAAELRGQGQLGHPEERHAPLLLKGDVSNTAPLTLGRAIFGSFFLYNGINHFLNHRMMVDYASAKGTPAAPVAVTGSGLMLIAGGLSLLTGVRPKIGSALITAFLAGVTPVMHAFWKETDPQTRQNELIHFSKNVALVGGAMFAAATAEPWPKALRA